MTLFRAKIYVYHLSPDVIVIVIVEEKLCNLPYHLAYTTQILFETVVTLGN